MADLGKLIIGAGVALIIFGALILLFGKVGGLPGDIYVKRGNFTFVFPIVACIILSILLTLALQFILRIRR